MKSATFLTILLLTQVASAQTNYKDEGKPLPRIKLTRAFNCVVAATTSKGAITGKAQLVDVVVPGPDYADDKETAQRSEITVTLTGSTPIKAYSERKRNEDPEEYRDEQPDSNWKGLQILINAATEKAVALRSIKEQHGKPVREYTLKVGKQDQEKPVLSGTMTCYQK